MIKHIIIKFCLICILSFGVALSAPAIEDAKKEPGVEKKTEHKWFIQHWKTPSGTPVYFIENHVLPIIDIQVVFKAGSAYDGQQFGLSHLTNELLNQGTKQASTDKIAEQLDMAGASYNANAGRDMAVIGMRSLTYPKQFDLALATFKDILSNPSFPQDAFDRMRKQTIQLLTYQEQNPDLIASELFYKTLYGKHPYAHLPAGTPETLAQLTSLDAQKFYQRYYTANNAIITLVGNLTLDEAKKMSAEITASLNKGAPLEALSLPSKNGAYTQHVTFPSNQTHLLMGQIALSRADPDYFALSVANYILGGSGLTSRLFKTVRENQGLAYQVASFFAPMKQEGPFYIKLQTESSQIKQAVDLVKKNIMEFIEQGPSKTELEEAKHHLIQNFVLKLSSNKAASAALTDIAFYGLPLDYLTTYQSRLQSITYEDVQKALKKHLSPSSFVLITVGKDATP